MMKHPKIPAKIKHFQKNKKIQKSSKNCLTNHICNVIIDVLVNDTSYFLVGFVFTDEPIFYFGGKYGKNSNETQRLLCWLLLQLK